MILTIQDFDKDQGTGLPMFSRAGKSTINQYLAFNSGSGKKRSVDLGPTNDEFDVEGDDIGLIMGEQPSNLNQEM